MSDFFAELRDMQSGTTMLAAWGLTGDAAGTKALFTYRHDQYETVYSEPSFPASLTAMIRGLPYGAEGIQTAGDLSVFLEPISKGRKLVICGAGHVSQSLVQLASLMDYDITVIDDRSVYTKKAKSVGAQHVICAPFDEALAGIPGDMLTAFVVMTREHEHDTECLRLILAKQYAYLGMMGSHSRTDLIRKELLEQGFDADRVNGIHMPIGLSIGSRTPAEIAVSVLSEIIRVMNETDTGEGFPSLMVEELTGNIKKVGAPPLILAMIVKKDGEAPRNPGAKMVIRKDGSFIGTIGGGYAENQILNTAMEMIKKHEQTCRRIKISMKKGDMYCGGEIEVFLMPL